MDELEQRRRPVVRRLLVAVIPAAAFVGLLAYGLSTSGSSEIEVGGQAPRFELPQIEGGTCQATNSEARRWS
jgi:hypothetical protein